MPDIEIAFLREYNLGPAETAALSRHQVGILRASLVSRPEPGGERPPTDA